MIKFFKYFRYVHYIELATRNLDPYQSQIFGLKLARDHNIGKINTMRLRLALSRRGRL